MRRAQKVYAALRDQIVDGVLPQGSPLPEQEISQRFGASRTPIREALQRLSREGLVELVPGKGAFVAEIHLPDIIELFQLREALEPLAARLAARAQDRSIIVPLLEALDEAPTMIAERLTDYYALTHRIDSGISALTQNQRLSRTLEEIWSQARRVRLIARTNPQRLLEAAEEHRVILQSILAGDEHGAEEATRTHLRLSLRNIVAMTSGGLRELLGPEA